MAKVAIGAGHGLYTAGKRTPDDEREWSFNDKVVKSAIKQLKKDGHQVLRLDDPTGKTDVPLRERTNKANAWGADILISVHHNAYLGRWGTHTGTETFIYDNASSDSFKLAKAVQAKIVGAYGLYDRGVKRANFHMLRESKMPAILTEGGYMDSTIDVIKMRDELVLENVGHAIADGVAGYFGVEKESKKEAPKTQVKSNTTKSKSISQMADEVERGDHGSGHDNRRESLKISKSEYEKVRAEVNRRAGIKTTPKKPTSKPKVSKSKLPNAVYRAKRPYPSGSGVKAVQQALAAVYYYPDKGAKNNGIDGVYGPKTADAVKRYQSTHGLTADGIYGPKTKKSLEKSL